MTGEALRVTVSDDSSLFREMLVVTLAGAGFDVVGEAVDLPTTLELVERTRPDVALLDIRMPPTGTTEGVEAATRIRAGGLAAVVLLSQQLETATAARLLESCGGSTGYLLKERVGRIDELVDAVERVHRGEVVLDPEVMAGLLARVRRSDPADRLTPAQWEVFALIGEGGSNRAIAARLHISERTVESHVSAIFDTIGLAPTPDVHRRVLAAIEFLRRST